MLYENIVISGEDISDDLETQLKMILVNNPFRERVNVSTQKDCNLASWIGLSVLSSLDARDEPVLEVCLNELILSKKKCCILV